MLGPVGPLPPAVYWRRRAVALAVVAALLGLVIWGFAAIAGGGGEPAASPDPTPRPASFAAAEQAERDRQAEERDAAAEPEGAAARAEAGVRTPEGEPADRSAGGPSATPAPSSGEAAPERSAGPLPAPPGVNGRGVLPGAVLGPLPSATAPRSAPAAPGPPAPTTAPGAPAPRAAPTQGARSAAPCAAGAVAVTARTDRPRYAAGEKPVLSLVVRNTGEQPCVRDLDAARQAVAVVRKPGDGVWSSDDCGPGATDDVRVLAPGEEAVFTVRWSGRASRPGCGGPREAVAPGRYQLLARLDETISAPAAFTLEG